MEPKDIQQQENSIDVLINDAFDKLEKEELGILDFQYNLDKNIDKVFPFSKKENIIELTYEEDISPLEDIFIEEGILPENSHYASLKLAIRGKKIVSPSTMQKYNEIVLSIEDSKVLLDESLYPNLAEKHRPYLALSLNFGVKRLVGISHHNNPNREIKETKSQINTILGKVEPKDKNFNSTAFSMEKNVLKRKETEEIRIVINRINDILVLKSKNREFTDLEVRFINWATDLLERKGIV